MNILYSSKSTKLFIVIIDTFIWISLIIIVLNFVNKIILIKNTPLLSDFFFSAVPKKKARYATAFNYLLPNYLSLVWGFGSCSWAMRFRRAKKRLVAVAVDIGVFAWLWTRPRSWGDGGLGAMVAAAGTKRESVQRWDPPWRCPARGVAQVSCFVSAWSGSRLRTRVHSFLALSAASSICCCLIGCRGALRLRRPWVMSVVGVVVVASWVFRWLRAW